MRSAVQADAKDPARVGDGLGRIERFELAKQDSDLPSVVFQRLTDEDTPETLAEIAKSMGFPRGKFVEWFTTEHAERYDAALKVLGDGIGHAVKKMTDEVTEESLKVVKFKTERYLRLASHWNPERYSPKSQVEHSGLQPLLLIEVAGEVDEGRVVDGEVVTAADSLPPAREERTAPRPAVVREHELI